MATMLRVGSSRRTPASRIRDHPQGDEKYLIALFSLQHGRSVGRAIASQPLTQRLSSRTGMALSLNASSRQ